MEVLIMVSLFFDVLCVAFCTGLIICVALVVSQEWSADVIAAARVALAPNRGTQHG